MIDIVLYEPEIPPNTGNIIRLCANFGNKLHLIEPLGFEMDDRRLRRAGLDYAEWARVKSYADYPTFLEQNSGRQIWGVTTKASQSLHNVQFNPDDLLMFGPETRGLPESILSRLGPEALLRIPMRPDSRSLNLANAVAIASYEAWRQLDFVGGR